MKYSELEKMLRRFGCYPLNRQQGGHPLWYSPKTQKTFQTSNHGSHEVAPGTLKKILRDSGLE